MNLLWGQNPSSSFCRLPYEQNPLLALNYENLCDTDYLSRLFATQLGEQLDLQGQPAQPNDNESWLLTADTAEDVIVFGEDFSLGKHLLRKRFLTGVLSSVSNFDILSTSVQRQVVIFEIIGRLIRDSALCQQTEFKKIQLTAYEKSVRELSDPILSEPRKESKKHLASEALGCALKTLARHSRDKVNRSSIDPILFLLLRMYRESGSNSRRVTSEAAEAAPEVDKAHLQYLREILCNGVEQGIEMFVACRQSCSVKENEENLKLSMSSAYGLLSVGIYAGSPGDILMAFLQLISISLLLDERQSVVPCIGEHNTSLNTNIPCRKPQELSEKTITVEHDELQKTQIKPKVKLKNKENCTNLFPIITRSPGSASFKSLNSTREIKHFESQNDLQQQQKIKNKKLSKWEIGHSRSITILDKLKDQQIQSSTKVEINSVKSRLWNDEDLNSKQVGAICVGLKVLNKKYESVQNNLILNNNNGRHSPTFDNEVQSQNSQQSLCGSRQESKPEKNDHHRINQTSSSAAEEDLTGKDKQEAFRISLKRLSYVPKSVLKVLQDGCADHQINSKTHASASSLKSSYHRSIVASKSCVWSCGQNSYGELGHGDGIVRKSFTKIAFFEGRGVVSIGAGNEHSVFVCVDGRMYVTGYNDNGQCGSGKTEQVKAPQQVAALEGEEVSQAFVFNGCEHTLVTTKDGKLYAFGYNYRGQLGHGGTTVEPFPKLVKSLQSKKVVSVACSYHHSVILCSDGSLYSCGRNDCGQLGHGDIIDKKTPHLVTAIGEARDGAISEISCGQFHTVILTSNGVVYACGKNDYGQTCLEGPESVNTLTRTAGLCDSDVIRQVSCGYYHTLLLSQSGIVTGYGRNDYGQLGLGHSQARVYGGHSILYLRDKNVRSLGCGCYHSIAVTANGMLYTFGRNNHGQLGTGDQEDRNFPHPVDDFVGYRFIQIAAGFYHTLIVAADPTVEDHLDDLSDPDRLLSGVSASSLEKLDAQQVRLNSPCCAGPKSSLRNLSSHSLLRGLEKKGDREQIPGMDKPLSGLSPHNRSKVATIRELLPFLVSFIQHRIVAAQHTYDIHEREKEEEHLKKVNLGSCKTQNAPPPSLPCLAFDFIWLVKEIKTLSVLLEMTRWTIQKYLQAGEGTVDSLFSAEVCDRLQHTLMLHTDYLMQTQKIVLQNLLQCPKYNLDCKKCMKKGTDNNGKDTNRDRDRGSCGDENDYSMSSLLSSQPRKELTAWELIQKIQGGINLFSDDEADNNPVISASTLADNSEEFKLIKLSMGQLRKELVLNYFSADCNAQGGPRTLGGENSRSQPFFNAFGSCLSDHFDTLFYTDSLRSEFLVLLGGLLSKDTADLELVENSRIKETEQYCRSLRLFIQILLKYRRIKEVLKVLVKPRRIYGLTVFQQLITVYSHLSLMSLKSQNQVQDTPARGIKIPGTELSRALNVLGQCNSNFVKCAVPLIFASAPTPTSPLASPSPSMKTHVAASPILRSSKSDVSVEGVNTVEDDVLRNNIRIEKEQADEELQWNVSGKTIIQGIFLSAECVLDYLANEPPTEDSINTLRYGAVITSVLPTVLIYGISNSRVNGCVQDLLPLTRSFTRSLQSFISGKDGDNLSLFKAGSGVSLNLGLGLGNNGVQSLLRTGTAASSSTAMPCVGVDSKDGSPSCPGTASTSEKLGSKCFSYVEEKEGNSSSSNTVKRTPSDRDKDLSHLTWWSRLLKLAYLLNAKLAASLLYDPAIHVKDCLRGVRVPIDVYQLCCPLSRHQIWSILTPPEDLLAIINTSAPARTSISPGGTALQKPGSGRSRQPMPLTPNSKDSAANSLYIKILNKCVIMRDRESASDLLYRSIQTALKKSVNVRVLVQGIEHSVFEAVVYVEGTGVLDPPTPVSGVTCASSNQTQTLVQTHARIERCSQAWTAIARLIKRIMSQRSVLVSENSSLTWLDTLTLILRQTNAVKEVILACTSSIIISPIGMSARVKKFPALRRVILVVVCMLRWNAAVRLNLKSSGSMTVGFISNVLESMTQGLTSIASPELMSSRWKNLLSELRAGSTDVSHFSKGLTVATEIVQETSFSSVKCDIVNSITAAWRNRYHAESNENVVRDGTKVAALCCTESAWQMRIEAGRALESYLCSVVRELTAAYLSSSTMSPTEIHFFSLVLSLLQLIFVCGDEDTTSPNSYHKKKCMGDPRNFKDVCQTRLLTANKTEILKNLEKVFIAIDVRTTQPSVQMIEDRTSSSSRSWGSTRDRSKALKKVSNAIISLYLALTCREGSARENSVMCNHVMNSHGELLAHLQKARQSAQQQMADSESQSAGKTIPSTKPTEIVDPNSTSSGLTTNTKSSAHTMKESSRRRCQELIVRPLEFCRSQEGFVVQGDSLLNNFKGIDFTLATWLYVDKKCPAGHSFITGRVSHHDAWPLILLRNDGKLDIIYGHNNNFECMASIAVVPLFTWTHVAVVIEQKKIKLFVNGVVDCQVNTKGNARAVVYPIVVGLCPMGLRTHVEHTRVGFDGLLAQYRYYTRALSPIHVRVVFDQGPPETYDVRERWLYRLLASSRLLLVSRCDLCPEAYRAHADELMTFFITDSTRRVRIAALKSLHVILAKDIITDLRLTVSLNCPSGVNGVLSCPRGVLISDCVALDGHTTFKERLVLYFIRIIGACWSPDITAGVVDGNDNTQEDNNKTVDEGDKLLSVFLSFAPTLFSEKLSITAPLSPPIFIPPALLAGQGDRIAARDASLGEISYHLISILRSLSLSSTWATAMRAVISKILSTSSTVISSPSLWLSLKGLDTLGCAVFLGESTGGPYLGATASSQYSVSTCHVLSIHKAMRVAIVMAWNSTHTKRQMSTVRLSDLTGFELPFTFEIQPTVITDIIKLLNALTGYAGAAISDLLCIFNPGHVTQRHQILRTIRPMEVLMYHQLLRSITRAPSHLTSTCETIRSHQGLLKLILQSTSRTLPLTDPTKSDHAHTNSAIFSLWTASAVHISSIPKKLSKRICSSDDPEHMLRKYLQECVGVAVEKFSGAEEVLIREGMFAEVLMLRSDSSNTKQTDSSANSFLRNSGEGMDEDSATYFTDWGTAQLPSPITATSTTTPSVSVHSQSLRISANLQPLEEFKCGNEQDSTVKSLQLVCALRQSIITSSRLLITRFYDLLNKDIYISFSMPWKMLMWHSFAECSPYSPLPLSSSSSSPSSSTSMSSHVPSLTLASPDRSDRMKSSNGCSDTASSFSVIDTGNTEHKLNTTKMTAAGDGRSSVRAGCNSIARVMFMELKKIHKHVTSHLASNLLIYLTSIKSKGEGDRGAESDSLDACDLFSRILNSVWVWLRLLEGTREEAEVCFEFLRIILPSLVVVHGQSEEHSVLLMKVCSRVVHRLLNSFLLGAEPSKELLSLVRGGAFTLLRAIAQDELSRRASYTLRAMAPNVRGLCDLISGLEGLQRLGCTYDFTKGNRYLLPGHATSSQPGDGTKSSAIPTLLEAGVIKRPTTSSRKRIADLQSYDIALNDTLIAASIPHCDPVPVSNTAPPQVVQTQSYSMEANLRPCVSSVRDALRSVSLKKAPPSSSSSSSSSLLSTSSIANRRSECDDHSYRHAPFRGDRDPKDPSPPKGHQPQGFQHPPPHSVEDDDLVVIEVAIALASLCNDDEDELPEFETVYCGSSFQYRQVGLTPSCIYLLRCRAASRGLVLGWSPSVEFTTDPGISFTFDPQKCGTDILLGEGNLKASYAGDDNWSTLLGSRSFSTGKVGWEIRVTHTSTAYLFVGVATSEADLNTYLGGCSHGWGFIGEQALYHSRENVKGYGEAFSTGDFIGISLDFHRGTLSFSRNGKSLGVAFDKICGELYPAVAFYNTGQELEIIPEGFRASCPQEATECSPSRLNLHGISTLNESFFCLGFGSTIPARSLAVIADHCNEWCSGHQIRVKTLSGKYVFISTDPTSPLVKKYGIGVGERVRTPIGLAELRGVANGKLWFTYTETGYTWFVTRQQIRAGREIGYFERCTYELYDLQCATSVTVPIIKQAVPSGMFFDTFFMQEIMDPARWPDEIDSAIVSHLSKVADAGRLTVWEISCDEILKGYRNLQMQLSRIVMGSAELSHRWGISGPKRRAVIARIGLLRHLNQELHTYLPSILCHTDVPLSAPYTAPSDKYPSGLHTEMRPLYDFTPIMTIVNTPSETRGDGDTTSNCYRTANSIRVSDVEHTVKEKKVDKSSDVNDVSKHERKEGQEKEGDGERDGEGEKEKEEELEISHYTGGYTDPPWCSTSSPPMISSACHPLGPSSILLEGPGLIPTSKHRLFADIKADHFSSSLVRSAVRPTRTEDDYDYPDDLPTVSINRFKSFRAKEESEIRGLSGEDFISASILCQVRSELKNIPIERLRRNYSHPMDDGQARTFKVKFEGEGVDDYGGPYRELFQLVCDELQMLDSSSVVVNAVDVEGSVEERGKGRKRVTERTGESSWCRRSARCFLPFLIPTPNFSTTDECAERYRYMFNVCPLSGLHIELYGFLGQLVGMAVRSKITLDLLLPSYIWKCIAREPLSEKDIASFDAPSARFINRLSSLYSRVKAQEIIRSSWPSGSSKVSEMIKSSSLIDKSVSISLPRLGSMGRKGVEEPTPPPSHPSPVPLSVRVTGSVSVPLIRTQRDPLKFKNRPAGIESDGPEGTDKNGVQKSASAEASIEVDIGIACGDTPAVLLLTAEIQDVLQDLDWTYVRSDGRTVELIKGGLNRPVTISDVGQYLQLYVEARLLEGDAAIQAFRSGLNSIIPESAFYLMSWEDVERVVCGSRNIDISRLQENTDYDDDVTAEDPHIKYFWETLKEFNEEEKVLFLKFVWARPTLPPKGMEFQQRMKIQSAVGDDAADKPDLYLPKAHTCFFSINLPRYSTKKLMTDKLLYAISNCIEMDADFKQTDIDVAGWTLPAQQLSWTPLYRDD